MTDLADFLRARYAEDAEAVRANWHRNGITSDRYHDTPIDPTRLLADLDVKLAIVDLLAPIVADESYQGPDHYGGVDACEKALSLLARPFAGHPDYKNEWRPTP